MRFSSKNTDSGFTGPSECQRCGKTLTVPSSIDARLGPECIKKV